MKKKLPVLLLSMLLILNIRSMAQNWVIGGNNLSANGSFGSNTDFSVIFRTNNLERARLTNTGLWGIGTASPLGKLHVNSAAGAEAFRAQVNGSTKLLVHSGGGVAIGASANPPANGLFVSGNTGIGTVNPLGKLHVNSPSGVEGFRVQVGGSTKLLVHSGGGVSIGSSATPPVNGLFVSGNAGIGTTSPDAKL